VDRIRLSRRLRGSFSSLKKGALLSVILGEFFCSPKSVAAPPLPTLSQPATVHPSDTARTASDALLPYVVLSGRIAAPTLYTWTTREQVAQLAQKRVLLSRTESPEHGPSYFSQRLSLRAKEGDELAKLLQSGGFAKARHAWPAPWATFLGSPGERYGDDLIQIKLKPEAWFVVFRTSQRELSVVDSANRAISSKDALAHSERIAAVYFVHDELAKEGATPSAPPTVRAAYREYVLCNESMIASYSVYTDDIKQELQRSADAVTAVATHLQKSPSPPLLPSQWNLSVARESWLQIELPQEPLAIYQAALSFPNELYLPDSARLLELADRLRKLVFDEKPIHHMPTLKFPKQISTKPKPPPTADPGRSKWSTF